MQQLLPSTPPSPWHPRDWEAHLLAGLLRSSRITVLYGEPGAGKTALLQDALLPLLRRRVTDAPSPAALAGSSVVIPFPDRRRQRQRDVEVVVCFARWEGAPLQALLSVLACALDMERPPQGTRLVDALDAWHRQRGGRFLLLLDQFEACLAAQSREPTAAEFISQLIELANHPTLPASVLLSLRNEAEPGLERLRHRIAGFDRHWLRLPHWQRGLFPQREPPPAPAAEVAETSPPSEHGFIRLDLTADADPPWMPEPAASVAPAPPGFTLQWLGWMVAAASLSLLGWSWWSQLGPHPAPILAAAPAPSRADGPPVDRIARDWAGLVSSTALGDRAWPAGFIAVSDQPPLALARHDALQAARRTSSGLQIVAPLYTEQIHVLVRSDSPIRALHELAGRRIAVDNRRDADALTVSKLFASLAAGEPGDAAPQRLAPEAALKALLDTRSVDAWAVVAPAPSDLLAGLDARTRQSVRLLPFDANEAGSGRVTQHYLPVAATADTPAAVSVMTFLVTRESPPPAQQLREAVRGICQHWPMLQREGHPAWQRVAPGRQLPVGWPYAPLKPDDWRACRP